MPSTIISDTSCFIVLTKIGKLDLLKQLYGQITTTTVIAEEFGEKLPEWVEILEVKDKSSQKLLELQIDKGESSAIVLAMNINDSTLILDDDKARKVAYKLDLKFTGTLGVIIKAKLKGLIPSIKPVLKKLKQTNFRLSSKLEKMALELAKEE